MLLTFLYHRVHSGKYANSRQMMEKHLRYLKENFRIVLPGYRLNLFRLNICLSFDDAYYDFYYFVFPLLKELKIKALLAVPIKFILDKTSIQSDIRLSVDYDEATKDNNFITKAPFCTFEEIKEMYDSGLVQIASHSYSHINLTKEDVDLDLEIIESKKVLEEKLKTKISTFVYPLGKFNERIHTLVKKHYKYAMRIGSAWNVSWQNVTKITYRIICDDLKLKDEPLKFLRYISYTWFFFLNTFRKR